MQKPQIAQVGSEAWCTWGDEVQSHVKHPVFLLLPAAALLSVDDSSTHESLQPESRRWHGGFVSVFLGKRAVGSGKAGTSEPSV